MERVPTAPKPGSSSARLHALTPCDAFEQGLDSERLGELLPGRKIYLQDVQEDKEGLCRALGGWKQADEPIALPRALLDGWPRLAAAEGWDATPHPGRRASRPRPTALTLSMYLARPRAVAIEDKNEEEKEIIEALESWKVIIASWLLPPAVHGLPSRVCH